MVEYCYGAGTSGRLLWADFASACKTLAKVACCPARGRRNGPPPRLPARRWWHCCASAAPGGAAPAGRQLPVLCGRLLQPPRLLRVATSHLEAHVSTARPGQRQRGVRARPRITPGRALVAGDAPAERALRRHRPELVNAPGKQKSYRAPAARPPPGSARAHAETRRAGCFLRILSFRSRAWCTTQMVWSEDGLGAAAQLPQRPKRPRGPAQDWVAEIP